MKNKQIIQRALISTALATSLASCGGGGGGSNSENPPPTVVETSQEDRFGVAFGTAFRAASETSEPKPVNEGDLVAVSLTTEPIAISP